MLVLSQSDVEEYGINWDGPAKEDNSENSVDIPEITCPPTQLSLKYLKTFLTHSLNVMTLVFLCILLHMHYHTLLHNYEHYHKNNMFHFLSLSVPIEVCLFV